MRFKTKAAAFVATAALIAALPGAAFAATAVSIDSSAEAKAQNVTKNYSWTEGTYDSTPFKFTVKYKGWEAQGVYTTEPTPGTLTNEEFTIAVPEGTGTSNSATKALNVVLAGATFDTPGIYTYEIKEVAGSNNNIVYNVGDKAYLVKVQVVNKTGDDNVTLDEVEIAAVKVYVEDANGKAGSKTPAVFTNDPVPAGSLVISKTIKGNAANPDDEFDITVAFTGSMTGTYPVVINKGGATTTDTFDSATGSYTAKLGHGDTVTINGLPQGVNYVVTEDNPGKYTDTYAKEDNDKEHAEEVAGDNQGTIDEDGDTIAVTNKLDEEIITGYLMAIAPYALMIALVAAAAVAFVVSRRRADSVRF